MEAPSIDISTYLLKTVTSHPYHQFQSIEFIYSFPYLHLSSAKQPGSIIFTLFAPLINLTVCIQATIPLPEALRLWPSFAGLPPYTDILLTLASVPHLAPPPSVPWARAPAPPGLCVLRSPCWTLTPVPGHRGSFFSWCTSLLVLPPLKVLGGKGREAEKEGEEEEEELHVLLNNEKPLALTSPNNHWAIWKSSIDLKTWYVVGLPGHLLPLLSPGCQALLLMS